ncbi:hypothetical protein STEG23_012563, partial [Scotinomys teguina]
KWSRMWMLLSVLILMVIVQPSDGGFGNPHDTRATLMVRSCSLSEQTWHPVGWRVH